MSRKKSQTGRVPVDIDQWSEPARRRLGYLPAPLYYEDRIFACRSCQCEAVFSAEQQKFDYEVKKAHYLRQHVLCPPCFARRCYLQSVDRWFESSWLAGEPDMRGDVPTLLMWLDVLQELPLFGVRPDLARIRMLERLASDAA
jgi:hypothetical protein